MVPALCSASSVETRDIRVTDLSSLKASLAVVTLDSDLDRLASRTNPDVLADALESRDQEAQRMALALASRMEDPAHLLPALVRMSLSRDRDLASRASHAARVAAGDLEIRPASTCVDQECALVELREPLAGALREALQTPGVGPDVRRDLLALMATPAGRPLLEKLREPVQDLLEDESPAVRVAAATLMTPPLDNDMLEVLLDAADDDDDPLVVGACLLAACAAMSVPEGREEKETFVKRVERFESKLDPEAEQAGPLAVCLMGLGEPWAEKLASRLPAPEGG